LHISPRFLSGGNLASGSIPPPSQLKPARFKLRTTVEFGE